MFSTLCRIEKVFFTLLILLNGNVPAQDKAPPLDVHRFKALIEDDLFADHIKGHHHLLHCSKELYELSSKYSKLTDELPPELLAEKEEILNKFYKNGSSTIHGNLITNPDSSRKFLLGNKRGNTHAYALLTTELDALLCNILDKSQIHMHFGSPEISSRSADDLYGQMKDLRQGLLLCLLDVFQDANQWKCRILLEKDDAAGDLQVLVQLPIDAQEKIKKRGLNFKDCAILEDQLEVATEDYVLHLTLLREPDRFVITSALLESNTSKEKFESAPSLIDLLSNTVARANMPSDRTSLEISQWLMNQSLLMIYYELIKLRGYAINTKISVFPSENYLDMKKKVKTLLEKQNRTPKEQNQLRDFQARFKSIEKENRKAILAGIAKICFASAACLDIRDKSLDSCQENYANRWADKILVSEESKQQLMGKQLLWFQNDNGLRPEQDAFGCIYHGSGVTSVVGQLPSGELIDVNSCRIAVKAWYYQKFPKEAQFFPRFETLIDFIHEPPASETEQSPEVVSGDPWPGYSLQESEVKKYITSTKKQKKDIIKKLKEKGLKELGFYTIDDMLKKAEHEQITMQYWPKFGSVHEVVKDQVEGAYQDTQLVVKVGSILQKCNEAQARSQKEEQEGHGALLQCVRETLEAELDEDSKGYTEQGKPYTKTGWFVTNLQQWRELFTSHNIKSITLIESQPWDDEGTKRHVYYVLTEKPATYWIYKRYFNLGKLTKSLDVKRTNTFCFVMDEDWSEDLKGVSLYPVEQSN